MKTLIKNGLCIGKFQTFKADLLIENEKIKMMGDCSGKLFDQVIDAKDMLLAPGFIDIHVHGGGGGDFSDGSPEILHKIVKYHTSHGTTSLLAAIETSPMEKTRKAMQVLKDSNLTQILGVYLEGPFFSYERRGGQNPEYLRRPSAEYFQSLVRGFEGFIKVVSLAPELEGADKVISEIKRIGAVPALGHSNATFDEVMKSLNEGVCLFTHFYDGMREFHHREPGVVGAGLLVRDVHVELIADGFHVSPPAIRLLLKNKGAENICLITDAVAAAGLGDGEYKTLGGLNVVVRGKKALVKKTGGPISILTMDTAVKNLVDLGVDLPDAIRMATLNPAKTIGVDKDRGSLEPGKNADIVILGRDLEVKKVLIKGDIVFQS